MGSKRREKEDKHRNERRSKSRSRSRSRSRERSRDRFHKERRRSMSDDGYRHRKRSKSSESRKDEKTNALNNQNSTNVNFDQEYFFRMSRRIYDGFKEDMDKELFSENLVKQLDGNEMALAHYKQPSICIQWLIENATGADAIKKLTEKFSIKKYNLEFVNNQFASHVIQALIEASLKILSRECTLTSSEQRHYKWSSNYISDLGEFVIANMDNLLNDVNGSHVIITIMEAVGGIRVGRHWSRKTMGFGMKSNINTEIEKDIVIKDLPSGLKSILKKFTKTLIVERKDKELKEIISGKATSIIQYLLFILKVRSNDLCQTVVKKLIDVIFGIQENKFSIITNSLSAYLVETIILVSSEHRLTRIWEKYLKGNLRDMWKDDIANFIVQRLVDAANSEELYQEVSLEILPHLASIFTYNRPGIGVCLAKATLKFPALQQEFIYAIMKAFHCYDPKERQIHIVPLMLFGENTIMTNSAVNHKFSKSGEIWLHGSLMLQYMFQYKDPYKLYKSLLSLEPRELVSICNDKSGSHVIDAFLRSTSVPEKAKSSFVERLSGCFVQLACDKFGSRIIDNILNTVNIKTKKAIMEEFSAKEAQLQNNKSGFFVSKNAGLYHYKHRYSEWKDIELAKERKRKTFDELLDEHSSSKYDRIDNGSYFYSHSVSNSGYQNSHNNSHSFLNHSPYNARTANLDFGNGYHLNKKSKSFNRPNSYFGKNKY